MASIFKKANGERLFRTDTDVREIEQQRVCSANSTLNSVHGSTLFNSATDGGGSKQNRVRTANSQLKNEHGRSFFSVPAGVFFLRLESAPPIFKTADSYRAFISSTESPVIFEIKSMPRFSYLISFAVSSFVWYEPSAMPSAKAISRSSARCTAISVS